MRTVLSRMMVALATTASLSIAGPNENAVLFIDLSAASAAVDSSAAVPAESSFVAGVTISGAAKLHDYQVYVVYDTARLRFVSAVKGDHNFLESGGGSIFFQAGRSRNDSTRILIGGSLTGDDASQCVDGGGYLSLITFKKLRADTTALSLAKILVEDCGEKSDTACVTHGATVYPGTIGVLSSGAYAAQRRSIDFSNGTLKILAPSRLGDARVTVSDISGRVIHRVSAGRGAMAVDMRSTAPGIYVISILQGNTLSSYPLLIKR